LCAEAITCLQYQVDFCLGRFESVLKGEIPVAEGLYKYIEEQNNKGKNLFGGIVVNKDGSWRYNDSSVYAYDQNNLTTWKFVP
jgi:hypothetical protein